MCTSTEYSQPLQSLLKALHDPAFELACSFIRDPTPGTAQWVSLQPWYKGWQDLDGPEVLILDGPAGVGKSVIVKHIFKTFDVNTGHRPRIKAYYAFNNLGPVFATTQVAMLRSLVHQVLTQAPSLLNETDIASLLSTIKDIEKTNEPCDDTKLASRLTRVLYSVSLHAKYDVYIFIDGLEEASPLELEKISEVLQRFYNGRAVGRPRLLLSTEFRVLMGITSDFSKAILYTDDLKTRQIVSLDQGPERQYVLDDIQTWANNDYFNTSGMHTTNFFEKCPPNFLWAVLALGLCRPTRGHDMPLVDEFPTSLQDMYQSLMRRDGWEDSRQSALHLLASLGGSCTLSQLRKLFPQSQASSRFQSLEAAENLHSDDSLVDLLTDMSHDLVFYGKIPGDYICFAHLRHQSLQTFLVETCTGKNAAFVARAYIKHLSLLDPSQETATTYDKEHDISTGRWVARKWPYYADKAFSSLSEESLEYCQLSELSKTLLDLKSTESWFRFPQTYGQSLSQEEHKSLESQSFGTYDFLQPGQLALMKVLFQTGNTMCHVRENPQFSALCCAVIAADSDTAEYWLTRGSDPGTATCSTLGPLFWACFTGNTELASRLLDAGACADGTAVDPGTISDRAITWLLHDFELRDKNPLKKRFMRFRPTTPLGAAVSQSCPSTQLIRLLISHGANVSIPSNGVPPLHDAICAMASCEEESRASVVETVEILLSHGAEPNGIVVNPVVARTESSINSHATPDMSSLLLLAIETSGAALPLVKLLVEHGASVTTDQNDIAHALLAAARLERVDILDFLLENGAVDALDPAEAGSSALSAAARASDCSSHVEVVRSLLQHAARRGQQYSALELQAAERITLNHTRRACFEQLFDARMASFASMHRQDSGEGLSEAEKLHNEEIMGSRLLGLVQSGQLQPMMMTTAMKVRHIRALMRQRKNEAVTVSVAPVEEWEPSTKSKL